MADFLRLPHFMKRRNAFRDDEREKKVQADKCAALHLDLSVLWRGGAHYWPFI